ncbi:chemotaxis response regulator protein-glutamate methylesterase [Treponema sp.]|uniref:protein-glutamate methylesterase/protein-glutamine glutaminase n=1 Tax=Treponema sp. TaxID=166 RepID=UPI00388FF01A
MDEVIKVLIIDDSALARQTITEVLSGIPDIKVIGSAPDPIIGVRKIQAERPDVIILDIEMSRMDGLTFLRKMNETIDPIPCVICSALVEKGSPESFKALELGAAAIILKPSVGTKKFFEESKTRFADVVRAANLCNGRIKQLTPSQARLHSSYADSPRFKQPEPAPVQIEDVEEVQELEPISEPAAVESKSALKRDPGSPQPKLSADVILEKPNPSLAPIDTTDIVVAVGASTGGTEALKDFLTMLPADSPGIVIVQHMPEHFTASFAQRLDGLCKISVREAEDGDIVQRGQALIAPGNHHLLLKREGDEYYVEIKDGPLVSRHRPSVDVLFRSAARYAGKNAIGVIMTGMGDDGAKGMKEMHDAGSYNIAQDEATCIVYGMPCEAVKAGAVDKIVPLQNIAGEILNIAKTKHWR